VSDRTARLDTYARAYARERFALIFTQGLDKRFGRGWPDAKPVTSEDFAAALVVGRCLSETSPRNVGVALAASFLVGVEVDTAEGLELIDSLNLPPTWTVRSGGGGPGRHFYFRPPADDVALFAFRIEAHGVTPERTRGLVLPPSIHPDTGAEYAFVRGPDAEIARMPRPAYDRLVQLGGLSAARLAVDVRSGQPIPEGYRESVLFRYCCALLRWGLTEDELKDAAQRFNRSRMQPPLQAMEVAQTARNVYRNRRYRDSHDAAIREVIADDDFTRLVERPRLSGAS
jgi:hypothetical protein